MPGLDSKSVPLLKTGGTSALALLFGRDRMVRSLTEHDFYGSSPSRGDRIRIVATVVGFESNDPANYPEWFRADRAVPKWLDMQTGQVGAVREERFILACQVGVCARFDRRSLDVEMVRYFHDDDDQRDVFDEETWVAVPSKLIRDLGFFLVPANRAWDRVMSFSAELFRRVVASGQGPPAAAVLAERDRLRAPESPLESDEELFEVVRSVNEELKGFFTAGPSLMLRVTSTDSEGVLDAVVPHYTCEGTEVALPAKRHGSGLVSLQWLLLLLQFGRQRAAAGEGFWMALEEPELPVPPPMQRQLVHRLQALSTQTLISTHSPTVASLANLTSLALVRNDNGVLRTVLLQDQVLGGATPNSVRKLFQLNRSDTVSALMHEAVLIPEGRLDWDWLRLISRAVDTVQTWQGESDCRFATVVGVIPTHDAAVQATFEALKGLHPTIGCLVDGDTEGISYADALCGMPTAPSVVVRWPDDWTIENVVVWILEHGGADAMAAVSIQSSFSGVQTPSDLVWSAQDLADTWCSLIQGTNNGHADPPSHRTA